MMQMMRSKLFYQEKKIRPNQLPGSIIFIGNLPHVSARGMTAHEREDGIVGGVAVGT